MQSYAKHIAPPITESHINSLSVIENTYKNLKPNMNDKVKSYQLKFHTGVTVN